jgi:hypothetical protein
LDLDLAACNLLQVKKALVREKVVGMPFGDGVVFELDDDFVLHGSSAGKI